MNNFEKYYERGSFENVMNIFNRNSTSTPQKSSSQINQRKVVSPTTPVPHTQPKKKNNIAKLLDNPCGPHMSANNKSSWIGRQIAAAYDEHASIINSLQKELQESKEREQALVQEFSIKFQDLKIKQRAITGGGSTSSLTLEQMEDALRRSQSDASIKMFDNNGSDDMPMDEMAHLSKMDRSLRAIEFYEQQLAMDKLKKESEKQFEKLRKKSENHIKSIESSLKEKLEEIERLKKEAEYYKKQSEESVVEISMSTATPSPGASIIWNDTPMQQLTPTHSLTKGDYAYPSPVNHQSNKDLHSNEITLKSSENFESPQNCKKAIDFNNTIVTSPENSQTELMNKLLKLIETKMSLSSNHDNIKNNRSNCDDDKDANMPSILQNLNQHEAKFLETINKVFYKTYEQEMKALTSLQSKLQESNKEVQSGASKASKMTLQIKHQEEQIHHLQDQLNSAHASIRNTTSLEALLKSMATDRQETFRANDEYDLKMKEIEFEKEELRKERLRLRDEADKSVSAIQRVMADVTTSKEQEIQKLTTQLEELREEIKSLQNKVPPSSSKTNDVMSSGSEQSELVRLREEASRSVDLMNQLKSIQDEFIEVNFNHEEVCQRMSDKESKLQRELQESVSMNKRLKEKLQSFERKMDDICCESDKEKTNLQKELNILRDQNAELVTIIAGDKAEVDTVLQELKDKTAKRGETLSMMLKKEEKAGETIKEMKKRIKVMDKQIEKHKDELMNMEEVLKAAKISHEREQSLEEELSELRKLLDNTMKNKSTLRHQLQLKEDELDEKTAVLQQTIYNLQSQIRSIRKENQELKTSLRKAEDTVIRTNRVLAVIQETSETEDSAPQIVLDMKHHLREQHEIIVQLREKYSNEEINGYIEKLSDGINISICLLEAAIFGNLIVSPKSVQNAAHWKESSALAIVEAQKKSMRSEVELELKQEQDQEFVLLRSELALVKKKYNEYKLMLSKKDEEMNVLRASLKESSVGYISGDDSDLDDESTSGKSPLHIEQQSGLSSKEVDDLLMAKEKAEAEAKQNAESLANAKMIISSLEQSKKSMIEDLKIRLHDSNAAIVSLLDQTGKYEKESAELRSNLDKLKTEKNAIEKQFYEYKKNNDACVKSDVSSTDQNEVVPLIEPQGEDAIDVKCFEQCKDQLADDNDEIVEKDAYATKCEQRECSDQLKN